METEPHDSCISAYSPAYISQHISHPHLSLLHQSRESSKPHNSSSNMVASVEPVSDPKAAAVLQAAKARFLERNPKSLQIHQDASRSMPGGNTRTVLHTAPFPVSMARGHGYQVFSEDGHTYAHHFHHQPPLPISHSNHPNPFRKITSLIRSPAKQTATPTSSANSPPPSTGTRTRRSSQPSRPRCSKRAST